MPAKAYSSFFFPEVNQPPSSYHGRSFLSFDNADSIRDDDEQSVFTSTTMSSFFPESLAAKSDRARPSLGTRRPASRSSSHPSLRSIPKAKPAPVTNLPVPPLPCPYSAPPDRTEYQHIGTRHYTSPSKTKKHVVRQRAPTFVPPPPPPPSQPRRMSTSTVSTNYRQITRAHALASLEGRKPQCAVAVAPAPQSAIPLNARSFIPLSDDDGDEKEEDYDPDLESEADEPTPRKPQKSTKRRRRRTIDSWFIGPPPSPSSSSTAPSFLTHDSDESFESPRPSFSSAEPFQVPPRGQFIDFDDVVDSKALQQLEYDAWGVVGEKRPEWLTAVLE